MEANEEEAAAEAAATGPQYLVKGQEQVGEQAGVGCW